MKLSQGDIAVNKAVALSSINTKNNNTLTAKLDKSQVEERKKRFFKKTKTASEEKAKQADIKAIIAPLLPVITIDDIINIKKTIGNFLLYKKSNIGMDHNKRYEFEVILRKSSSLKNQKDQYSAQSVIGYGEMPKVREKDRAIFFRSIASELQCALETRLNARITGLDTRLCSGAYDG